MSVIVRGMKMPENCRECPFEGYHSDIGQTYCMACSKVLSTAFRPILFDGRPKWCPLVKLSEPKIAEQEELFSEITEHDVPAPIIVSRNDQEGE